MSDPAKVAAECIFHTNLTLYEMTDVIRSAYAEREAAWAELEVAAKGEVHPLGTCSCPLCAAVRNLQKVKGE